MTKADAIQVMEMSTGNLPPLRNLPSWSRVRDLDRVRYPRLLTSDPMVRSPPVSIRSPKAAAQPRTGAQDTRIASLEKDIIFLQQQHRDTLERLHAEIEHLKRANKACGQEDADDVTSSNTSFSFPDLQFQLVMEHEDASKESVWSNSHSSKSSSDGSGEKNSKCGFISSAEASETGRGAVTSLLPLRISCSPSQNPRTPTLKECELIIRQLYDANGAQYQELLRIKTLLGDIASKHKSSADIYSLARACLCDSNRVEVFDHFPKLPLKALPKKQLPSQAGKGEAVILPAIKGSFSSSMSERQRRAQDLHRMRFRRAVDS